MNLIIDIGNTATKVEIFENDKSVQSGLFALPVLQDIIDFLTKNDNFRKLDAAIISTVAHLPEDMVGFLSKNFKCFIFDHNTKIPITNAYTTPDTLGKDRLAAAVGAYHIFPDSNTLVIDCGTCIKYDFINSKNSYLGGAISPGIEMRFKALHTFTEKLPLINYQNIDYYTGNTTEASILSGVINGTTLEIEGMVDKYKNKYKNLNIILSGGTKNYFEKKLNFSIFAVPNIVTFGLNYVLNYNKSIS